MKNVKGMNFQPTSAHRLQAPGLEGLAAFSPNTGQLEHMSRASKSAPSRSTHQYYQQAQRDSFWLMYT